MKKYNLIGVGDFDPYCLNKVCVAQISPAPTPEEQEELKKIAATFFTERDKGDGYPRLTLVFENKATTVRFTQPSTTRTVDRRSFQELLVALGFHKENKSPQGNIASDATSSPHVAA